MKTVHIPDVLESGCFTRATIGTNLDDLHHILVDYEYTSKSDFKRYEEIFAEALRNDFVQKYGAHIHANRIHIIIEESF